MSTGTKPYPYTSFRFRLEIGGITVAQFSEVSGLQVETETERYEEGGVNEFVHELPKRSKYQHISLKRGITDMDDMWNWYQETIQGRFERKNGSIILMDAKEKDKWRWDFFEAYPVKWTGPELRSGNNTVAFEAIDLAHNGIIKG